MSTVASNVFKSRWGFHAADYDTYRKLKALHKWYWASLHAAANCERWHRKQPQNRILRRWTRDEAGRKVSFEVVGPRPEPKVCPLFYRNKDRLSTLGNFVGEFQNVRTPKETEQKVLPLRYSLDHINQMYFAAKAWFEENV